MFGSCFLKLFLRIFFENTENVLFVFFENCSYYFDLVFSVFFIIVKNMEPNLFSLFSFVLLENSF